MLLQEKFIIAEYKEIEIKQPDAFKLRGFFADLDYSDTYMHNHEEDGKSIYRYPQVQYKVVHHHPMVVAFGEGIKSLYPKLMSSDRIRIGKTVYESPEVFIRLETRQIGDSRERFIYKFITPWLALNQKNYQKYTEAESQEKKRKILERILIGNILSLCQGFGVTMEQKLEITSDLEERPIKFKGELMIGFLGEFEINAHLPSLCGLGKGVSRGMGTIVKRKIIEE